jgi:riboflavin kinase/FMN adenylyltransferase
VRILADPHVSYTAKTAVILGNFDGFHRAHKTLAKACVAYAKQEGLTPAAFCFVNPPDKGEMLTDDDQKARLMKESGIELLFTYDFALLKELEPKEFVEKILLDTLQAKAVFCGFNYRFGKGRSAGAEELKDLLKDRAQLFVLPPVRDERGEVISSSKIRALLAAGNKKEAEKLLGHSTSQKL